MTSPGTTVHDTDGDSLFLPSRRRRQGAAAHGLAFGSGPAVPGGATAVAAPYAGADGADGVDLVALRRAVADDVVTAVVVDHPDGRDGLGDVGALGRLAAVLDTLAMAERAELLTPSRVIRLVRSGEVAVVAEFPRRPDVLARLDDVLPVDLDPSEHPTEPAARGLDDWNPCS